MALCVCCWAYGWYKSIGFPVYGEVTATPYWNKVHIILYDRTIAYIAGILLTLGGAFIINRANYVLVLTRQKTELPLLLYTLLISTNPSFFPVTPASAGVFCLILAIYQTFNAYHDKSSVSLSFNASFLIGLGSLLWVNLLWFLPILWIGMYNFRSFAARTFLASFLGAATVYWFLIAWCAYQQDFSLLSKMFSSFFLIRYIAMGSILRVNGLFLLLLLTLSIISFLNIVTRDTEDTFRTRQFHSFLMLTGSWALIGFFLFEQSSKEFLQAACIPASILISHLFTMSRGKAAQWIFYGICLAFFVLFVTFFLRS